MISVTTEKACQGTYSKIINVSDEIVPYPVPFQGTLNLNLGLQNVTNAFVKVHSISNGRLVFSKQYVNISGVLQLDLSNLDTGTYALELSMDRSDRIFKVTKQ